MSPERRVSIPSTSGRSSYNKRTSGYRTDPESQSLLLQGAHLTQPPEQDGDGGQESQSLLLQGAHLTPPAIETAAVAGVSLPSTSGRSSYRPSVDLEQSPSRLNPFYFRALILLY